MGYFPRTPRPPKRVRKPVKRSRMAAVKHVFHSDGTKDHRGDPRCAVPGCGLPYANERHDLRPADEREAEMDARKLGEGSDDQT
jgi:hypothetical protein